MAIEYNAIALGIVGLMFYMLELASRINLQASGEGMVNLNDLAKTILTICSMSLGIGLVLFMYGVATANAPTIETVLLVLLRFWVVMTSVVLLFLSVYYFVWLPRIAEKVQRE